MLDDDSDDSDCSGSASGCLVVSVEALVPVPCAIVLDVDAIVELLVKFLNI